MSEGHETAAPARPPETQSVNDVVARRLEEVARLLEIQRADVYRVGAWRSGGSRVRRLDRSVAEILREEGTEGLEQLPDIGPVISRAIKSLVVTGRLPILERLRGEMEPDRLLASVPGIGRKLAARLHRELNIVTLEDLEAAAESGRLGSVEGFGAKRVAGILDTLASRLGRARFPRSAAGEAPVAELLAVDAEYRRKAAAGELRRIAPRRFNPKHEAWLPVLHTERGGREYTALFSNTARAHELGRTRDWVVIYHDGAGGERRETVVTVRGGALAGKRIVRGREEECARFYREGAKTGTATNRSLESRYAYTGNVHDPEGESTFCHGCGDLLIGRDRYELKEWNLTAEGRCRSCGAALPGVLEEWPGVWNGSLLPVKIGRFAA